MRGKNILLVVLCAIYGTGWAVSNTNNTHPVGVANATAATSTPNPNSKDYKMGERLARPQASKSSTVSAGFKETGWDALIPKDWDPMKDFKNMNFTLLGDADPKAMEALQKLREAWDKAPVEPSLNGARIRIPGFVVPLDGEQGKITEFLLVPYYGGCIHSPPPPANQIIHVVSAKPLNIKTMDPVWTNGVLETVRAQTDLGIAGYRLKAASVTPYQR